MAFTIDIHMEVTWIYIYVHIYMCSAKLCAVDMFGRAYNHLMGNSCHAQTSCTQTVRRVFLLLVGQGRMGLMLHRNRLT